LRVLLRAVRTRRRPREQVPTAEVCHA
jgi:hypothetical protein